ncbi:MAG: hypothetical protein LAQ30_01605 [Acidobacteriia bacterium]|nr:hypothetical protein [Terriglobia bacterium]
MFHYLGEAAVDPQAQPADSLYRQLLAEAGPSEEPGFYVYKATLAAGTPYPDLSQAIDSDSDFLLVAIFGLSAGAFSMNIKDQAGRPVYSTAAASTNVMGTAQIPVAVRPALRYIAGSRLGFSLTETSGAANAVEIVFAGIKRFRTAS